MNLVLAGQAPVWKQPICCKAAWHAAFDCNTLGPPLVMHAPVSCCTGDKEIVGTLRGFDVYVNMVLEDVQEIEVTPEGKRITKLDQILLNGNNIAVLVPGGKPEDVE